MLITIDKMTPDDWDAVRSIYYDGIATGNATFETDVPDWQEWDQNHLKACRLVARNQERVVGWCGLIPLSKRAAFTGVAEVTTYVEEAERGKSIGSALLSAMVSLSEEESLWSLQAFMFPENKASVSLHKHCGFRKVGVFRSLGRLGGKWRDVLIMERRSAKVGL